MTHNPFRNVPPVNTLLAHERLATLVAAVGHSTLTDAVRHELEAYRAELKNGGTDVPTDVLAERVVQRVRQATTPRLRTVINATGIVLHTNLGRSPLADVAADAAYHAARGYLNLELDLQSGQRSSRQNPIREVLCPLLQCESATVVNNCAAATVLTLRALAAGKEVIVSRGQLVEIGGSFRIPEIMAVSGATLKEVGTTNITRIRDYEAAITPQTGLLLRVHHSNYCIRGFTEAATLEELVALGRKHHLPVIDDVGSGAMLDFARFQLPGDPIVPASLAAGADLVLFSGDKLLGGPQAGIIAGKKELVAKLERDPLMRAFRLDKMTLAALEATLRLYQQPDKVTQEIPILRMLSFPLAELQQRAERLAVRLQPHGAWTIRTGPDSAFVGGGSLPDQALPTYVLALRPNNQSEAAFAERLRQGEPAVLARIHEGAVLFDLRTVFETQEESLHQAIIEASK